MLKDGARRQDLTEAWRPATVIAYLAGYLCLEWATFVPEISPLGIAPWNPSAGLSLAALLLLGKGFLPVVAVGLLSSDLLVRDLAFPWWVEMIEICAVLAAWFIVVVVLERRVSFDRGLRHLGDLVALVAAGVVSSVAVASVYVGVLAVAGLLPPEEVATSVLRHAGGDLIGIMAVTPAMLVAAYPARLPRPSLETVLQGLAILTAVLLVMGGGGALRQQLFYVLFLPLVWIAVRSGLAGASAGLLVLQLGLMVAVHAFLAAPLEVEALQAVLLVLAFSGLAIGMLVDERRNVEERMRKQQEALERAGRIAGMGSFSSSLAHEINQPLTAVANYARAAQAAMSADPARIADAQGFLGKGLIQVDRASEVIRKLRDLFETGRIEIEAIPVGRLVRESIEVMRSELDAAGAVVVVEHERGNPIVRADRVQIELVIVNLLRNALEAMQAAEVPEPRIVIRVSPAPLEKVQIAVSDNGPGFPADFDLERHGPGQTGKIHGLGLGLTLVRSIVEAHDGRLSIARRPQGATVVFTLRQWNGETNA